MGDGGGIDRIVPPNQNHPSSCTSTRLDAKDSDPFENTCLKLGDLFRSQKQRINAPIIAGDVCVVCEKGGERFCKTCASLSTMSRACEKIYVKTSDQEKKEYTAAQISDMFTQSGVSAQSSVCGLGLSQISPSSEEAVGAVQTCSDVFKSHPLLCTETSEDHRESISNPESISTTLDKASNNCCRPADFVTNQQPRPALTTPPSLVNGENTAPMPSPVPAPRPTNPLGCDDCCLRGGCGAPLIQVQVFTSDSCAPDCRTGAASSSSSSSSMSSEIGLKDDIRELTKALQVA